MPNNEAIPAATIPLGPTQLINIFSFTVKDDLKVLTKTPIGRNNKITHKKTIRILISNNNFKSEILMLAASRMNSTEMSNTLIDSLKYNISLICGTSILAITKPMITTVSSPESDTIVIENTNTAIT